MVPGSNRAPTRERGVVITKCCGVHDGIVPLPGFLLLNSKRVGGGTWARFGLMHVVHVGWARRCVLDGVRPAFLRLHRDRPRPARFNPSRRLLLSRLNLSISILPT